MPGRSAINNPWAGLAWLSAKWPGRAPDSLPSHLSMPAVPCGKPVLRLDPFAQKSGQALSSAM
jgi:hypothetical protein